MILILLILVSYIIYLVLSYDDKEPDKNNKNLWGSYTSTGNYLDPYIGALSQFG